jgi:hypothetical protein
MEAAPGRRSAGRMLMIVGIPNAIVGLALFIAAFVLSMVLAVALVSSWGSSTGDPMGDLCMVLVILLLIFLLIAVIVVMTITGVFSLGLIGMSVAGYYAMRGVHYRRSMVLGVSGAVVSGIVGSILLVLGAVIIAGYSSWVGVVPIAGALFEILTLALSIISLRRIARAKSTFAF